jgi:hypothetical protein
MWPYHSYYSRQETHALRKQNGGTGPGIFLYEIIFRYSQYNRSHPSACDINNFTTKTKGWHHVNGNSISKTCVLVFQKSLRDMATRADFLGFLQKSVRHRFLTLNVEPFRFGLRIRGDIRNRKTTPRLAESGSRQECL